MKKRFNVLACLIIAILILTEPLRVLASSTADSVRNEKDDYETNIVIDAESPDYSTDEKSENEFSFLNFERLFRELKDLIPSAINLADGGQIQGMANIGAAGSSKYINATWYVPSTEYYGHGTTHSIQELDLLVGAFSNTTVDRGKPFGITPKIRSQYFLNAADDFTYTSNDGMIEVNGSQFTAVQSGMASMTATHRLTGQKLSFTVRVLKKAIIIVPGIFGTCLDYDNGTPAFDETLLEQLYNSSVSAGISLMNLLRYSRVDSNVFAREYEVSSEKIGFDDVYGIICRDIDKAFANEYEIVFFSYDWRKSCAESAKKLAILCKEYDEYVFVCHSMGGIVASSMLVQNPSEIPKTKSAFFIATPFMGSPICAYLLAGGDSKEFLSFGSPITDSIVNYSKKDIIVYMQSALELLPIDKCKTIEKNAFLSENTYSEMIALIKWLGDDRVKNQLAINATPAKDFSESLWVDGKHITCKIPSFYICGDGLSTIVGATYSELVIRAQKNTNGDGIVPVWSATLNGDYGNVKLFIDKETTDFYSNKCQHLNLVQNKDVINYIIGVINDR